MIMIQSSFASPSIVGGQRVTAEERPWVVKITNKGEMWCSGSVLNEYWIISAAHCFDRSGKKENFEILGGGSGNIKDLISLSFVDKVVVHPRVDLALIKLMEPIRFDKGLAPIEILDSLGIDFVSFGALGNKDAPKVHISGWGHTTAQFKKPEELSSITLPAFRTDELTTAQKPYFFNRFPQYLSTGHIAVMKNGATTCTGDSGTGWTMVQDNKHYLVGVHSAGDFCRSISIAVETGYEMKWILSTIAE